MMSISTNSCLRGPRIFTLADLQKRETEKEELAKSDALSKSRELITDSILCAEKRDAALERIIDLTKRSEESVARNNKTVDKIVLSIEDIRSQMNGLKEDLFTTLEESTQYSNSTNRDLDLEQTTAELIRKRNEIVQNQKTIEEKLNKTDIHLSSESISNVSRRLDNIETKNQSWFSKSVDWVKKKLA